MDADREPWERYGRALIGVMAEVLEQASEDPASLLLETADYWLGVGLALSARQPEMAARLLHLIESNESNRTELEADAMAFSDAILG
jgi:hypothetical protein